MILYVQNVFRFFRRLLKLLDLLLRLVHRLVLFPADPLDAINVFTQELINANQSIARSKRVASVVLPLLRFYRVSSRLVYLRDLQIRVRLHP